MKMLMLGGTALISVILAGQAAAATCSVEALTALKIADVSIASAATVAAVPGTPEHCLVQGSVITRGEGAPEGKAGFVMQLPTGWQQRFFFMGVGGNAGNFTPSSNPVDRAAALGKGYATIVTDTGHKGNGTDASWVLDANGKRNPATIIDFFHRAAHDVTIAGKKLAEAFYASRIQHAYFDGCSTGGRMAMNEAELYPEDFDGIIAGDPAMDYRSNIGRIIVQRVQLASPEAYIPATQLPIIDKAVRAQCDALDGVKDGLIQNPAACKFKPDVLLCKGAAAADCLTAPQLATLKAYLAPIRDAAGKVVYPGQSPTDLAGMKGAAAWSIGQTPPDFSKPMAPWGEDPRYAPSGWNYARQQISYWLGYGTTAKFDAFDVDPRTGKVGAAALKHFEDIFAGLTTREPSKMDRFVKLGKKMIMYHGFSDPAISPFRTTQFYREFAGRNGGYARAQQSLRLFMVPGMAHCSAGPGPENFDTLTALENWVEKGKAPTSIMATATEPGAMKRTMPLCPFPAQAVYKGTGDVNDGANWSCTANRKLLENGKS